LLDPALQASRPLRRRRRELSGAERLPRADLRRSRRRRCFVDASESGADAFFLSGESLVPTDPGSADLYDAREGGGFPAPATEIECEGDSCQGLPSEPEDPQPGTLQSSPGNPPLPSPKRTCPKGKKLVRRHGKEACVTKKHSKRHGRRHKRGRR
jgi:hypothetical protein